ncbi:MAG: hypothetical protein M0Z95_27210 [Actinomycetota bacterium]|nr:hypothetical protein [Actinomycetota bacterium]
MTVSVVTIGELELGVLCAARRRAGSVGEGIRAAARSKSSPARDNTSASIGSDLFFPASADRSRAECRFPTSASSTPDARNATASGSHVIDVRSAMASVPGHFAKRLVRLSIPGNVGAATKSSTTSPALPVCGRRTTM